jgi:hypothetical protein
MSDSVHQAAPGTSVPSAYENQTPATKHTPGPWSLFPMETGWYVNQQGGPGYVGTMHTASHRAAECEANARLIAAAPELLEALEIARNGLRWYQETYHDAVNGCDDEAMAQIDAAIAKAVGSAA